MEEDRCKRCNEELTDNNFGDCIEAEEIIVCDSCARKHKHYIIGELNKFRESKEFNELLALRRKILWASESLGNMFDAGDKSYIESVSDYNNYNVFDLQIDLLDILQSTLQDYIFPKGIIEEDYNKAIKRNLEMEKLRIEVRNQQSKIVSYINIGEFMNK